MEETVSRDEALEVEETPSAEAKEERNTEPEQIKHTSPRARAKGRPSKLTASPTRTQVKKEKQDDKNVRQIFVSFYE